MAKICIAFYNALYDSENENKMPCWYEAFCDGLRKYGNDLLLFQISEFQKDYGEIDAESKEKILKFDPDLCIAFNNVFYDLEFVGCPVVVYEADGPLYWSNKDRLKEKGNCYLYALMGGERQIEYLEGQYGIKRDRMHLVIPFTSVQADKQVMQDISISFIGTRFGVNKKNEMGSLADAAEWERKEYWKCLEYVEKHPYATREEVIRENYVTSERIRKMLDLSGMLMMMSAEKRVQVLSGVVDLGLRLYGTRTWMERYHFDTRLNAAYVDKEVYSLKHNQDIYNRSIIGVNISHFQAKEDFPWRVLDIMASNACLISDGWSGVSQYFQGIDIPIYHDEHEARKLCKEMIANTRLREEIVSQCHEVVEERFRFCNLLSQLEEITNVSLQV